MSPKITIIIPIYKVERYLPRCLDSVLNQTFADWSAILVDDGSPDNSGKIADEYAARDNRFIVIHKKNAGVSAARNTGLDRADGEYIMFLDSDDCIHPQTVEILYTLAKRKNADIVSFDYNRNAYKAPDASDFPPDKMPEFFKNNYNLDKIKYKFVKNLITKSTNEDLGPKSWYVQTGMTTMRMYRRNCLGNLRFDTKMRILEDTCFWSLVLLRRPSGVITRLPLYFYTVNSNSLLHTNGDSKSTNDIICGFWRVAKEYQMYANKKDMRIWYKRFFWSIMSRVLHGVMRNTDVKQKQEIAKLFQEMKSDKIFDVAPDFHARRYRRRMFRFISRTLNP